MLVYDVRNVHEALWNAVTDIILKSVPIREEDSRYGRVMEFKQPVTTVYRIPEERVLFYPKRNANPFFHFFEGLWMLAGRQDVELMAWFNKRMNEFSDNGVTFHAAYGYRWRQHFGRDQLESVIDILKKDPLSRRAILTMWDPNSDLGFSGKDFPCNMIISFQLRDNILDMRVHNRSNDLIWGAYGANAVHMSMMMEYVAGRLGAKMGSYYQISDNLHVYTEPEVTANTLQEVGSSSLEDYNYYTEGIVEPTPMFDVGADPEEWDNDLERLFGNLNHPELSKFDFHHKNFFGRVAVPIFQAFKAHKEKNRKLALINCGSIAAKDWNMACEQWLRRIYERS